VGGQHQSELRGGQATTKGALLSQIQKPNWDVLAQIVSRLWNPSDSW